MSYILNALRKAEQEHQTGNYSTWQDQGIREHIDRKKFPGLWFIGALILINLATLSFFIWFNPSDSESSPEFDQEQKEILVDSDNLDAELPMFGADSANLYQGILTKPGIQQALKKNTRESFAEIVTARKVAKAKRIQISQEQQNQISADKQTDKSGSVQKKKIVLPMHKKPEPLPEDDSSVESIFPADQQITGENMQDNAYIPTLKELPLDFRRSVPKININVYVYSEDVAERFVVVDMVKYTSGSMIVDNMELKEIQSDSLVVDYRGETFRIMRP